MRFSKATGQHLLDTGHAVCYSAVMKILAVLALTALAACGGGGGSTPSSVLPSINGSTNTSGTLTGVPTNPTPTPAPTAEPTVLVGITIVIPQCEPGKLLETFPNAPQPNLILLEPTCNAGPSDTFTETSSNPSIAVAWVPQSFNRDAFYLTGHGTSTINITDTTSNATLSVSVTL